MDTRFLQRITFAGFLMLVAALCYYQIFKGAAFLKRARANYLRVVHEEAIRGSIRDSQGMLLAQDVPIFNLSIIPYQVRGRFDEFIAELSSFLHVSEDVLRANYKHNLISRFSPVAVAVDIDKESALRAKERFKDDVLITDMPHRLYVQGNAFSHVIGYLVRASSQYELLKRYGYTPSERIGTLGVEQYYNAYLKGKDGGRLLEVDSRGKVVGFLGINTPERGKDIVLTIDGRIQKIAHDVLGERKGAIILMRPFTGKIIALCSSPSYSLNDITAGKNVSRILNNRQRPMVNRAIQGVYPPGSIFKPVVATAALEESRSTPDVTYTCNGSFELSGFTYKCWSVHGKLDLRDAIVHSCNVYFYHLGLATGIDAIYKWGRLFGFGSRTGIDLPYEKSGIVGNPRWKAKNRKTKWFTGDTVNMSIGQGFIGVTPIQAAVAVSAFANGGYIVRPHLLKEVEGVGPTFLRKEYLSISQTTLRAVREGMRGTVSRDDGTAFFLKELGLSIAGKTGTAQNPGDSHGWFAGFFPYRNPRYSIVVFMENAGSSLEALNVVYEFLGRLKEEALIEYDSDGQDK